MIIFSGLLSVLLSLVLCINYVESYARLIQPTSRASLWRFDHFQPVNIDDYETNCGGFDTHYGKNGGKCGPCGDDYSLQRPRPHERTGKYGSSNHISILLEGSTLSLGVDVVKNRLGHFEYRLCHLLNIRKPEPEDCFDYILYPVDGSDFKLQVGKGTGYISQRYQLPPGFTCNNCVIQWRYITGDKLGVCEDGQTRLGCGNQEEFRSCLDLMILSREPIKRNKPMKRKKP